MTRVAAPTVTAPTFGPARTYLALRPRRLGGIRTQKAFFKGSTVEATDDGVHLFRIWRFYKREALGLLRFRIANHFNRVRDQVLGS